MFRSSCVAEQIVALPTRACVKCSTVGSSRVYDGCVCLLILQMLDKAAKAEEDLRRAQLELEVSL